MSGTALSDLLVIEYAQGVAGPFCGKAFADYGADVIKVEPPEGDRSRRHGPFPNHEPHPERSGQFIYLNNNKRSVTLDLDAASGMAQLRELLRDADVFIVDLPPQKLESLGLTYEGLKELIPRLVVTAITPFGLTGPYRDYKGNDFIAYNASGLGWETPYNEVTDPEHQPPLRSGGYQADYLTGWTAATATVAALAYRDGYGVGQLVDLGGMESGSNMLRASIANYTHNPTVSPMRRKVGFPWVSPCKDGFVSISATMFDHWWRGLKEMMGEPEWAQSELFDQSAGRNENVDVIEPLVVEWMADHSKHEIYEMALARQIACFPVNSMAEVVNSRQYKARDFWQTVQHPEAGSILQPGPTARFSATPWGIRRPAPRLGEHNAEVLGKRLRPEGVMGSGASTQAPSGAQAKPLAGVRIADFGWILAVPHATAWLATLGAEVIRVESSIRHDTIRAGGMARGADMIGGLNRGAMWNGLNYGKKAITLNLGTPRGVELAKELVRRSDIVTENFAAGVFESMGLGYSVLKQVKPDIIMLSGSPLGQSGPDRLATGWGPNTQAYSGLPHLTGYEGGPASGLGGLYPDYMIGVQMAYLLLAALHHKQRTGEGQLIEVAMAETVTSMIPEGVLEYTMNGLETPRRGNTDAMAAPNGVYRCSGDDEWVAVSVQDDEQWRALAELLGRHDWANDGELAHIEGRRKRREEIDRAITEWTRQRGHYDAMHTLQHAGIAAAACLNPVEIIHDPHINARGLLVSPEHPEVGERVMVGLPGRLSAIGDWPIERAPLFGEHNEEVYSGLLGLSPDEIARLVEEKVIH